MKSLKSVESVLKHTAQITFCFVNQSTFS